PEFFELFTLIQKSCDGKLQKISVTKPAGKFILSEKIIPKIVFISFIITGESTTKTCIILFCILKV
ncbi:MAG: hypothetical protein WC947_09395, partial [Elusimicrobiota bacterium]